MIFDRIFGRGEPSKAMVSEDAVERLIADAVAAERSAASRAGYVTQRERERARVRETTVKIAELIGRPDLAEPLR